MEMVALRSSSFQAKFIGTIVSMSGALIVVLYKGPTIFPIPSPQLPNSLLLSSQSSWVMGGLLLTAQCLLFALWFIILTNTMKMYPSELVISFFHCLCVTLLCIPVGFIAETNLSAWRPTSNTAIMTFIYSGFFGPAFLTVVHSWSLHLKGPLYVAIFKPLSIVIAVVTGIIFLGDALHLGSVIGALTLSTGFYAVIWGKANEEKISKECGTSSTSSLGASTDGRNPLLQREEVQAV